MLDDQLEQDKLEQASQRAAEYISPHRPGMEERLAKREKQKALDAEVKRIESKRPIAYDANGVAILGDAPPRRTQDADEQDRPLLPVISLGTDIPDKELGFLWKNRFSNEFGLLAGRQGLGKSTFTAYLAANITNADCTQWADGRPCPTGAVMFFTSEGGDANIKRLIRNMGGDLSKFAILNGLGDGRKRPDGLPDVVADMVLSDIQKLEQAIDATEQMTSAKVHLIVIDPITDFMGDVKQNDAAEVSSVLRGLDFLAVERNICILGVKHPNKNENLSASIYRVSGSNAFTSKPRFVHFLDQHPEARKATVDGQGDKDRRLILAPAKFNNFYAKHSIEFEIETRADESRVVKILDVFGTYTADQLQFELMAINQPPKQRGAPRNDDNYDKVVAMLEAGETSPAVIAAKTGVSKPTVTRYKKEWARNNGVADKDGYHSLEEFDDFSDYQ